MLPEQDPKIPLLTSYTHRQDCRLPLQPPHHPHLDLRPPYPDHLCHLFHRPRRRSRARSLYALPRPSLQRRRRPARDPAGYHPRRRRHVSSPSADRNSTGARSGPHGSSRLGPRGILPRHRGPAGSDRPRERGAGQGVGGHGGE